ncbi:MAG: hypothetical protein JXB34_14445 [Bacteroidales bacterium]|nr:hypothetical protein [Bacteroidales bacterium]
MKKKHFVNRLAGITLLATVMVFAACEKDLLTDAPIPDGDAVTEARAVYSNRTVNWNNRAHDSYSYSEAAADFGNLRGTWQESRAFNSNGTCRVTLLKNALSGACGLIVNIDVTDGKSYEMDWQVKFHSAFDWSRGGKLGFGFHIGDGNTGCDPAWDGNGGTLRVMWYQTDAGRVFLQPYVYYRDQPGNCGNSFGKSYPSSGSLSKGTWYNVHLWVQLNNGSNTDGWVEMKVNGTNVLRQQIRWVTNDSKRSVREITFHTFRGGSQTYWQSASDGYIYYDNLYWNRVN